MRIQVPVEEVQRGDEFDLGEGLVLIVRAEPTIDGSGPRATRSFPCTDQQGQSFTHTLMEGDQTWVFRR